MGDAPPLNRSDTMSTTRSQTYKLTPISALLGRTGSQHIILGYLSITPTGFLSISDPTGAVMLDIRHCREGSLEARYTPGMVVVVQGLYEEIGLDGTDGSGGSGGLGGQSGVGGLVGGRFTGNEINQPPTESRALSLGLATENVEDEGDTLSSMGPTNGSAKTAMGGFGYFDFSGLGSYRALGERMERISRRVLSASSPLRNRIVVLGECNLDDALTLAAMRRVFTSYATSPDPNDEAALVPIIPLAFVLTGNFTKYPVLAGGGGSHGSAGSGGSVGYKEVFDSLSAILADYPLLLAHSSFIFVPGDNDAWASSYSAGASTVVPRRGVPALFTSRLKRTFATAISESRVERGKGKTGDAIWTTNPSRIGLFGPTQDITVFRDNISSRMRRHGLRLDAPEADMEDADADLTAAADAGINPGSPGTRPQPRESHADSSHRPLLTSLLSQSTLSPFLPTTRPVLWDQITSLSLYPLPNVLILVDPYMRPFVDRFDGCLCLNPGPVLGAGKERWAVMGELTLGATEGTVSARSRINGRIRRLRL